MPLPEPLIAEIRQSQRRPDEWFSIDEIRRRDPDIEIAAKYIVKATGKELIVPRDKKQRYEKLEVWAARLLEHEVRLFEQRMLELCSQNSLVPTSEDEVILVDEIKQFVKTSVERLKQKISQF